METTTKKVENGEAEKPKRTAMIAANVKRFSEAIGKLEGSKSLTEEEEKYLINLKIKVVQRYMGMEV